MKEGIDFHYDESGRLVFPVLNVEEEECEKCALTHLSPRCLLSHCTEQDRPDKCHVHWVAPHDPTGLLYKFVGEFKNGQN